MCAPVGWNAAAEDNAAQEEYEKAIGLIEKCTLTCNATEEGVIYITAKTQVSSSMEEVGYKNITIQHSDDGENWTDEQVLSDLTKSNARYYNINNLKVKVKGTGNYRVVCVHYAKGVPFGESTTQIQTAINTSAASYLKPPSQPTTTAKISSSTSTTTRICLWPRRFASVRWRARILTATAGYISGWRDMESITIPKQFSES